MKLASAAEMHLLDKTAIEDFGLPGLVLMENAGRATLELMERELGHVCDRLVPIFVGPGNNGGDGLVIARYVHQKGGVPYVVHLSDPDRLTGDAAVNSRIVAKLDIPRAIALDSPALDRIVSEIRQRAETNPIHCLVDALFGTGLKRQLKGYFLDYVHCINLLSSEHCLSVTAVDIPSGLHADTGQALGASVRADITATYGLAKPGHFMDGGSDMVGDLHVLDISIPAAAITKAGLSGSALGPEIARSIRKRAATSHKGNFGHLLVLAGSTGKTGAALLTALGALRVGTGLVTLCVPHDLNTVYESSLAEAMTIPLPRSTSCLSIDDYPKIAEQVHDKTAVVIGPGIGTAPETMELVAKLYREVKHPMVVDADGLNLLALQPDLLADPPAPRLLTPHPGEMSRLTGTSTADIQNDRLGCTKNFLTTVNSAATNVTILLKGAGTLVCDPEGTWAVNTTGNPGMASGGMGDVLSGILGGFLAQGYAAGTAARLGTYLHGLAADRLAQLTPFGYLASEVADMLPVILSEQKNSTSNL